MAEGEEISRRAQQSGNQRKDTVFAAADIKRKQQTPGKICQHEPRVQQMRQPARIVPQSPQKIIVDTECKSQQHRQQKLAALHQKRLLHSAKQPGEKPALLLRLFIQKRIHGSLHRDLPAVN